MLSIENINCIIKVAECLSIHKASEFFYKTPSQVSRIVKNFEDTIGLTIFERTNKGLILTEDGEVVLQYCKALIQNYQNILDFSSIKNEANKFQGTIDFYTSSNVQTNLYNALSAFNTKYPNIIINSHTVSSERVVQRLSEKNNAIGFLSQIYTEAGDPYYEIPSILHYAPITYHDAVCLLCNQNSSIAKTHKIIPISLLEKLPLIDYRTYDDAPSYTATLLEVLDVEVQRFRYVIDDIRTLTQLLEKNLGYYIGIYADTQKLSEKIIGIPIKKKIRAEAGLLIQKNNQEKLCLLLYNFLKEWYSDLYSRKRIVSQQNK